MQMRRLLPRLIPCHETLCSCIVKEVIRHLKRETEKQVIRYLEVRT